MCGEKKKPLNLLEVDKTTKYALTNSQANNTWLGTENMMLIMEDLCDIFHNADYKHWIKDQRIISLGQEDLKLCSLIVVI